MFFASQGKVLVLNSANGVWAGTTAGPATAVAVDPKNPKVVYAGGWGMWKSTDSGKSWAKLTRAPSDTILGLSVDTNSVVYVATQAAPPASTDGETFYPAPAGVWRSTDGGSTWTNLKLLPGLGANGVLHDPLSGNVYAGTQSMGMAVYARPTTPVLSVSPPRLTFSASAGGTDPAPQNLVIANTGVGSLTWTAAKTQSWLSLGQITSTLASGASIQVPVHADPSALIKGQYTDAIVISAAGAGSSPWTAGVTLNVAGWDTTTTLTTAAPSAKIGIPVKFTAKVSTTGSHAPTGAVTFIDGENTLGNAILTAGSANYTTSALVLGTHSITAAYPGDSYNAYGKSDPLSETIIAAPTVTTTGASAITSASATLSGTVTANFATTQYWFVYGLSATALKGKTPATASLTGGGVHKVNASLTGLSPKTKYFFALVATNAAGTTIGSPLSFTTQ